MAAGRATPRLPPTELVPPAAAERPLSNRVDPFGCIFARPARGLFMGNRGGRLHDPATQTLGSRRWVSKSWICCETSFKERRREVWAESYTELFFLDEVTALAAGHRPCFECRRRAAEAFAAAFAQGNGLAAPPHAAAIDKVLHAERLARTTADRPGDLDPEAQGPDAKQIYVAFIDTLPDGAMITCDGPERRAYVVRGAYVLPWAPEGYGTPIVRPRARLVSLLTPPSIVTTLQAGYQPVWHPSATLETDRNHHGD